jgi:membrane protease YdiL (CAAX protease family)
LIISQAPLQTVERTLEKVFMFYAKRLYTTTSQQKNQAALMLRERKTFFCIAAASLPIAWAVLQAYLNWFARPLGAAAIRVFPTIFARIAVPPNQAGLLASSLVSLLIFGIAALIWPESGFGESWTPNRTHGLVIASLVGVSLVYPILNSFMDIETPAVEMGFAIWTITPVAEEILFRGFLYALLLRLFGLTHESPWEQTFPVLVVGALWFSLWHVSPPAIQKYGWKIIGPQAILTFGAGILFNSLRFWTRSVWLLIPVHAAGNFMISIM